MLSKRTGKGSFLFINFPKRGPRYFSLGHQVLNPYSGTGASLIEHAVFMVTEVAVKCPLDGLDLPFDLWNTRGPRNLNHLISIFFFFRERMFTEEEGFTVAGSEVLPICRLDPTTMNVTARGTPKRRGRQMFWVPSCQLGVSGSLRPLSPAHLSPSFSPSVCSVLSGSDTVLSVWCAGCLLSSCHQAGLLVFIVVFLSSFRSSVVSRLCSLVKSVQSVLPVVCFFFGGCGTTSR